MVSPLGSRNLVDMVPLLLNCFHSDHCLCYNIILVDIIEAMMILWGSMCRSSMDKNIDSLSLVGSSSVEGKQDTSYKFLEEE